MFTFITKVDQYSINIKSSEYYSFHWLFWKWWTYLHSNGICRRRNTPSSISASIIVDLQYIENYPYSFIHEHLIVYWLIQILFAVYYLHYQYFILHSINSQKYLASWFEAYKYSIKERKNDHLSTTESIFISQKSLFLKRNSSSFWSWCLSIEYYQIGWFWCIQSHQWFCIHYSAHPYTL